MQKKKVLFVAHHLTIGGVQKSLISALNFIDYEKNEVTLYLRKNRLVLLPYINKNVAVVVNDDRRSYYRHPYALYLQMLIPLKKALKKDADAVQQRLNQFIHDKQMQYEKKRFFSDNHFDLAIAYNEGFTAEFAMDCVSATKKVMFFQSSVDSRHEIHSRVMPQFDAVMVEHPDIRQALESWYNGISDRIRIIENYTDYRLIREMSREYSVSKNGRKFMLCTCARFSREKGIDLAVEAARLLSERRHSFVWYMVGDGPEMEKVEKMVRDYKLEDTVILPGMQKNPYPYMADCDIYVQPSREEALSIAMLEAQMLCAPMVSTKTAGGCAMVDSEKDGLLCDIDALSIATVAEMLLADNGLRRSMRNNLSMRKYSEEEKRYRESWNLLLEG